MAAMEMSYPVTPPSLLNNINLGDKISFTIDPGQSAITAIEVLERAR
jgi:Cu/Ag efflux protein CusF